MPTQLVLYPAMPNPFAGATTIRYYVPVDDGELTIGIYDVTGRLVSALRADGSPGPHEALWDGRDDSGRAVASGVYFVRASFVGRAAESTVVLMK
ncbi:T9SS type A sorting domain-containing protein [bacterium]|nr:T9SS type A sorting domain-containing protein [bacterium]